MKKAIYIVIFVFASSILSAQTTVIGPANNGDFENATPATNWTIVNPADNARWFCGNQSKCSGTNGAYIGTASNNNNYVTTTARRAHIYRDVTFPAGETNITLSFDWKGQGESTFDGLKVFLGSTGATPVANTAFTTTDGTAVQLGATWYNLQAACATVNITIPAANAGTTKRLVFTWQNDGSGGSTPAATLDNVTIVTAPPPANDACAGSTLLTSGTSCTTTAGNTTSGGYSNSGMGCTAGTPDDDIWYSFVAVVSTHTVTVDGGADFDAVLGAYNTCGGTQPAGGTCIDATGTDGIETLTLTGLTPGTTYYLKVHDFASGGGNFTICVTHLTLCTGTPTGGTASAPVTSASCSTNSDITGSGYGAGSSGLSYQWQSSLNNSTWANIAGATTPTLYSATSVTVTTYYHLVTTCSNGGGTGTSTSATVTINPVSAGTTVSSASPACSGTTFTLSLTGNSTTGVTYQMAVIHRWIFLV